MASRHHPLQPLRPQRIGALVCLVIAAALSGWLAWKSAQAGAVPGCDSGGCSEVLASRWAKVFGVPVGFFGSALYLALAILGSRPIPPTQTSLHRATLVLALLIPGAALWFGFLQAAVVRAFCPWCTSIHVLASAGAVLMLLALRRDSTSPTPSRKASRAAGPNPWPVAAGLAALALAGFVLAQSLSPAPPQARIVSAAMPSAYPASEPSPAPPPAAAPNPDLDPTPSPLATDSAAIPNSGANPMPRVPGTSVPAPLPTTDGALPPTAPVPAASGTTVATTAAPPETPRLLRLHAGRFTVDPHQVPVFGSADARHLVVMISDYTCRYCRAAHATLHEVRQVFDDATLGIVMLPTQHGGDSLEIQRLMLAAWKIEPAVWSAVADDVYSERLPATPAAVLEALGRRVGADRLRASVAQNAAWIASLLEQTREIIGANRAITKSGNIPQFIFGQQIVVGQPADAAEVYTLLASHLGLVRDRLPDLRLAQDTVDLGRVFAGTQQAASFPFQNAGNADLTVSRAGLSPGGRALSGLQTPVPPGATSAVSVAVVIPRAEGPFEEKVTLFNNGRTSAVPARVTGVSWKPLTITPGVLDFGRLEAGNTATQAVMKLDFAEPAVVASVTAQNPAFKTALREVEPGKHYEITVSTPDSLGEGLQQSSFFVRLKDPVPAGWPQSIAVGARAIVQRAVTVVPPRLVIPNGPLAADRHHNVLVRCSDATEAFDVTSAVLEGGPAFALPEIERTKGGREIVVKVTLPAGWSIPLPPLTARLVLETTHPRYRTLEVPIVSGNP